MILQPKIHQQSTHHHHHHYHRPEISIILPTGNPPLSSSSSAGMPVPSFSGLRSSLTRHGFVVTYFQSPSPSSPSAIVALDLARCSPELAVVAFVYICPIHHPARSVNQMSRHRSLQAPDAWSKCAHQVEHCVPHHTTPRHTTPRHTTPARLFSFHG